MTSLLQIAVEGLVSVLLILTIGYCMLLNMRLKRLRADEANLRATISELLTATEIAERAITGLKQTASDCDKTLAQRLREAEFFSMEISREISEGEKVLGRIAAITQAARAATTAAQAQPAPAYAPAAYAPAPHAQAPVHHPAAHQPAAPVMPPIAPRVPAAAPPVEAVRPGDRLGLLRSRAAEAAERLANIRRSTTEAA
ncbi:DUF6468 domain-containing protein [Methyloraptor flagellatus]|uniref:DUF6468 domain-containing protein n=1 Tax=Methyloraptor flagellatus TaxID=3162530 RepID=A0AAU7XCC0_9HYPH